MVHDRLKVCPLNVQSSTIDWLHTCTVKNLRCFYTLPGMLKTALMVPACFVGLYYNIIMCMYDVFWTILFSSSVIA